MRDLDLMHFAGAGLLTEATRGVPSTFSDILAFVDVHEAQRRDASGSSVRTKYEVWCPGYDLSKAFFAQCCTAATGLVQDHGVRTAVSREAEARQVPEVSRHLTMFVQRHTQRILRQYGIADRS